jgi:hypothetical protein
LRDDALDGEAKAIAARFARQAPAD